MAAAKTVTKATPAKKTAVPRKRPASAAAASEPAAGKPKLVRDSFTIPKSEYQVLVDLKERAAQLRRPTKKSELLRAGVAALHAMNDKAFLAALAQVPSLKTGRPKEAGAGL